MSSLRSIKAEENNATGIGSPSSPPSSSSPHTSSSSAANAAPAPRMTTGTTLLRPSSRIIKKGDGGESSSNSPAAGPTPRSPSPPPPTTYRDIPLLSVSSATPWVHHLARFVHHQRIDPTDPSQFVAPLKLNRKQPPKPRQTWPKAGDTLVDRYGRPVRLASGRELTWPKQGEDTSEHRKILERLAPQSAQQGKEKGHANGYDASLVAPGAASAARASNRPLFQKRVRQIHKASATARRIHNDESVPWVLEDFETGNHWESSRTPRKDSVHALARHFLDGGEGLVGGENDGEQEESKKKIKKEAAEHRLTQHAPWIGKLEGGDVALASGSKRSSTANGSTTSSSSDASAQVLFVFDERNQGGFKVIPLRKTYRFMQKSRFADERGDEEREKEFERLQKSRAIGATDRFAGRADRGGAVSARGGGGGGSGGGGGMSGLVMPGTGGSRGSSGGVKKEENLEDDWPQLRGLSLGSYVPSRPRGLVAVSGGSSSRSRRGMDDDDDVHGGGGGDDGTYDEVEYHEDFADDEERMGGEAELVEDADEREREERLRREMVKAGIGEGMGGDGVKEEEDEDEDLFGSGSGSTSAQQQQPRGRRRDDQLTGSGRQMKKIMRALARREGQDVDGLYDSDEDDDVDLFDVDGARGRRGRGGANPYADDEGMGSDEDEEEPALANPEEAIRRAMEEKREREAREAKEGGAQSGAASGSGGQGSERTSRGSTPTPGSAQQQQQQQGARTPTQTGRGGQQASSSGRTTPSKRPRERDPSSSSQGVRPPPGSRPSQQGKGHHDSAKRAASSSRPLSRPVSPSAAVSRSPSPGPSQQGQGQMHAPRQSSPLAHPSSTMTEGQAAAAAAAAGTKRPASPQPSNHAPSSSSRPASPTSSKRPRTDSVSSSSSQPSTRRSTPNPATTSLERELINLVRSGQVKSIAEVIAAFKKRLQARPELKGEMMGAFKRCLTGGTKGEPLRVKEGL